MTTPLYQRAASRRLLGAVELREGSLIETRAPRFEDLDALARGIPELRGQPQRLARLANPHAALVAVAPDGEPIGVARLMRQREGSNVAHVAVAVVEQWRGRGVATALLSRLAAMAASMGVERFALDCRATPGEALALGNELGPAIVTEGGEQAPAVHIELPARVGYATPLSHILRKVAAGRLSATCALDGPPPEGH